MCSLLYLSRRRRDVQVVSYFFGFSVHASQRSLPSLWSFTNVRTISCQMICLFCCDQNRSAWIDCSKNCKYEIKRKNVRWELHCSVRMGGRSGWRNDGHAHTHAHTCIYADRHTHTHKHILASRTRQQIALIWQVKGKGLPEQAEVAQVVPSRLRPRIFLTFGTTRVVGRRPYAPAAFTPGKIFGTHF